MHGGSLLAGFSIMSNLTEFCESAAKKQFDACLVNNALWTLSFGLRKMCLPSQHVVHILPSIYNKASIVAHCKNCGDFKTFLATGLLDYCAATF